MRAIILEGTQEELIAVLKNVGKSETKSEAPIVPEANFGFLRTATPKKKKAKTTYKKKPGRKRAHHARPWTQEEIDQLKDFYADKSNFTDDGYMIGRKVEAIAKQIGRTKPAVENRISTLGWRKQHEENSKSLTKSIIRSVKG